MADHINGHANGAPVLERIHAALVDAEAEGRPRPGRPSLVAMTGASEYQVRRALEALDAASGASPPVLAPGSDRLEDQTAIASTPGEPAGGSEPPAEQPAASTVHRAGDAGAPAVGGQLVAWLGFVFGSMMSIAANVLHTWLPAANMPAGWTPGLAPQIGAAVWPIALLLSVEALSRVAWPHTFWWSLARYGGAGVVAAGAAVISYDHLKAVLLAWGYGHPGADVGPLVLDGLMVVSGFALLAMSQTAGHQRREAT